MAGKQAKEDSELLVGRNPVLEALRSGRPLNRLFVAKGSRGGSIGEILELTKERGIPYDLVGTDFLNGLTRLPHQGVAAKVAPYSYVDIDDILAKAFAKGEEPFLLLLDGVQDPHNFGSLLRTAAAVGAQGAVVLKRDSCPLTATVAKAAAGALEHIAVARVANMSRAIERLQKAGCWVVGAHMQGRAYEEVHLTGPLALVIGAEGKGLSRLTAESCDELAALPMPGGVGSLNAAVAGGIFLYEALRRRRQGSV